MGEFTIASVHAIFTIAGKAIITAGVFVKRIKHLMRNAVRAKFGERKYIFHFIAYWQECLPL